MDPDQRLYCISNLNRRFWAVLGIIFGLGWWPAGCSLFETRDAEEPDQGTIAVYIQPDRPEVVLQNLENAIEAMSVFNYLRAMDEEVFMYTPNNAAQLSDPDLWSSWGYASEESYFNNLSAASKGTTGHSLQLSDIITEIPSPDTRNIFATYILTVIHNRTPAGIPNTATGTFVLELKSGDDGLWSITGWSDIGNSDSFSWSDLRAAFIRN